MIPVAPAIETRPDAVGIVRGGFWGIYGLFASGRAKYVAGAFGGVLAGILGNPATSLTRPHGQDGQTFRVR